MTEFDHLCSQITHNCQSIRKAIVVILIETTVFILVLTFTLGVEIGRGL